MKQLRVTFLKVQGKFLYGQAAGQELPVQVDLTTVGSMLPHSLSAPCTLHLLDMETDSEGILHPQQLIYQPDYLLDISSLAACYTECGAHPFTYLLNRMYPSELKDNLLLGNAANQFLDDCINQSDLHPISFEESIRTAFREDALRFTVCPGINGTFFQEARRQYQNIHQTMEQLHHSLPPEENRDHALLEPSFICNALGVQGRMDYLQQDLHCVVELKSGKSEEYFQNPTGPKLTHAVQVMLYSEVLYYNRSIPREEVKSLLLYSKYPRLYTTRFSPEELRGVLTLRNAIVFLEEQLSRGKLREAMETLQPEDFNTKQIQNKLWTHYLKPQLQNRLAPFHQTDALLQAYFHRYLQFTAREQYLAKVGTNSRQNAYCNLWLRSAEVKRQEGDLLENLRLDTFPDTPCLQEIGFTFPQTEGRVTPNFRKGDLVLFYECVSATDNATTQQVFKGTLTAINGSSLTVALKQHQRNRSVFHPGSRYALEHDYTDASFNYLYRGLYQMLQAPKGRIDWLLGRCAPQTDRTRTLEGHYLNTEIDRIVLRARQAKDFLLIVGPPGTGKTSIALKSIVEEHLHDPSCNQLLLSYTNRAVDEICEALERIPSRPFYIRLGSELGCAPKYAPHTLGALMAQCEDRSGMARLIQGTTLFVGTVASVSPKSELFHLKHFQLAIVDEASQILEPQLMALLTATHSPLSPFGNDCAIDTFLFIGDHKQLPAVVQQPAEESAITDPLLLQAGFSNCRLSLFERLYRQEQLRGSQGQICQLSHQGRMHPALSLFVNRHFYQGELHPVPLPHQKASLPYFQFNTGNPLESLLATHRIAFLPATPPQADEPMKSNASEAQAIAQMVFTLVNLYRKNNLSFDGRTTLGIIAPFRNQTSCIRRALEQLQLPETQHITIDTVERFQGSQRDIILYSTAVSLPAQLELLSEPVEQDGQWVDRKLNVALTRARQQFFFTGIPQVLSLSPLYKQLLDETFHYQ